MPVLHRRITPGQADDRDRGQSPIHPTIKVGGVNGWEMMPTDVSLSASDLLIDDRWIRTRPTVQVEGGSYSLDGARQLQDALHHLLGVTADEEAVTAAP